MRQRDAKIDTPPKRGRGRPRGGKREIARQLGVSEASVRRSCKVGGLPPNVQECIREHGLNNNRTAMLVIADGQTEEEQLALLDAYVKRQEWRLKFTREQRRAVNIMKMLDESSPGVQRVVCEYIMEAYNNAST